MKAQRKILLIDKDSWWANEFVVPLLTKHGFHVEIEPDPEKAILKLKTNHFELIVVDYFSGENKLGTLRYINEHFRNLRVIVVSADPSWKGARDSFRMGAIDYLNKSYDEKRIVSSVLSALSMVKSDSQHHFCLNH